MSGIPVLLLLDAVTGEIINPNGRGLVLSDPKARNMSWKPINLCKVLLEKDYILAPKKALENPSEYQHQRVLGTTLRNKIIGIYFASTYVRRVIGCLSINRCRANNPFLYQSKLLYYQHACTH